MTNTTNTTVISEVKTTPEVAATTNTTPEVTATTNTTTERTIKVNYLISDEIKSYETYKVPAIVKVGAEKPFENALNAELQRRYLSIVNVNIDKYNNTIERIRDEKNALAEGETLTLKRQAERVAAQNSLTTALETLKELETTRFNIGLDLTKKELRIVELYADLITPITGVNTLGKRKKLIYDDVYNGGVSINALIKSTRDTVDDYVKNGTALVPEDILESLKTLFKIIVVEDSPIFKKWDFSKKRLVNIARRLYTIAGNGLTNNHGESTAKAAMSDMELQDTILNLMFGTKD